ncbi:MAG: LdpA C-terminal domain-containing domain [Phormidesmis sp.]
MKARETESPADSLRSGHWFKLICGASYQALPAVRNLTLAYALAGADCIDVAADPAVVAAAKAGLAAAERVVSCASEQPQLRTRRYPFQHRPWHRPWLMVSMSAGEDPHFRKAWFDPAICPTDCPRPCEKICPADAIAFTPEHDGVIRDRCYGCGRCLPVCPLGLIEARSHPTSADAIAQQLLAQVDALEIHTQVGQIDTFNQLWQILAPWSAHLKLLSISCPNGEGLIPYLQDLQCLVTKRTGPVKLTPSSLTPLSIAVGRSPLSRSVKPTVMWQTDGRPMSGDIGKGTTHATIRLAQKVMSSSIVGPVQLAGGTNQHTVPKLDELGLLNRAPSAGLSERDQVAGIAYGSFARRLLMPVIEQTLYLEEDPHALWKAVELAESLVGPLKQLAATG